MDLTEKEKNLFRLHDKDLKESPSYHVEDGLMQSYNVNDDTVQVTFGYIKRVLLEVAKKRKVEIPNDIEFDMDELLKEIINIPNNFTDFNVLYYKNYDMLNKFVKDKIKGMNSYDMEEFLNYFTGIGGLNDSFREFMSQFIFKLSTNINMLNQEIDEKKIDTKNCDNDWIIDSTDEELDNENEFAKVIKSEDFQDWEDVEDLEDFEQKYFDDTQYSFQHKEEEKQVTDEELINYLKFLNSYPKIMEYKNNGFRMAKELRELTQKTKLNEFYSNEEFCENFKQIMAHNTKKHIYHFHGTQDLQSAKNIINEGLGMMRKDLSTTTYSEFSMDEVILYSRGFGGEIGREAIVIIDEPIEENGKRKSIVEPLVEGKKIHFCPSGLQGLAGKPQYIVNPQYIVGYVDKINKKIIFNSKYYDYDKFRLKTTNTRPKDVPFSNERIADGIADFNPNELEEQKDNQL